LGRFVPAYYRGVFRGGNQPLFDPVSVGVGQGLTQGAAGGVVAGLVLIAILAWRDTRPKRPADGTTGPAGIGGAGGAGGARHSAARVLIVVGGLLALAFCSSAGLVAGGLLATRNVYHRRYVEERDVLAPALAGDAAFSDVEIDERSRGGADLIGVVPSPADRDRLRAAVARALGEARADEMLFGVSVGREGR
jgi:hypothetical protein